MFTPESLLEIALEAEQEFARSPSYEAAVRGHNALYCSALLEAQPVAEARFIGPFGTTTLSCGSVLTIRKGTQVHSYTRRGNFTVGKTYRVKCLGVEPATFLLPIIWACPSASLIQKSVGWGTKASIMPI